MLGGQVTNLPSQHFSLSIGFILSQDILQCEVGEDGGALAQHADKLLC